MCAYPIAYLKFSDRLPETQLFFYLAPWGTCNLSSIVLDQEAWWDPGSCFSGLGLVPFSPSSELVEYKGSTLHGLSVEFIVKLHLQNYKNGFFLKY